MSKALLRAVPLLLAAAVGCASPMASTPGTAGTTGAAGTGQAGTTGAGGTTNPYAPYAAKALRVMGNKIVDTTGATVRLLGVNRAGTEYMCVPPTMGSYVFDGATGPNSITAMLSWKMNTVRLPLNESCWLGISGTLVSADQYKNEIVDYVQRLHARGLYVILDLHWSAPGNTPAIRQTTMAYAAHAPAFWTSVATTFKDDPMVIFDLFNEPILDATSNAGEPPVSDPWGCWLNGCVVSGNMTAGMQLLIDTVRATGATQPLVANGVNWAHRLDQWIQRRPADPMNNLIAGFHLYNDGGCAQQSCWDNMVDSVSRTVPVLTGELGQRDCAHGFIDSFMTWADARGISYLGWAWNVQNCNSFPALISNVDGTPTNFGIGLRDHLLSLFP
jgi:endoglucanase